jgi:hypothetical protein
MISIDAEHKAKLMHDLRVVIDDAQEMLRMTADQVGDSAVGVRARVSSTCKTLLYCGPRPQATQPTSLCTKTPGSRLASLRALAWWSGCSWVGASLGASAP